MQQFLRQSAMEREGHGGGFETNPFQSEIGQERSDAIDLLFVMDDLGPDDLLICLGPVSGIGEEKGCFVRQDQGPIAAAETAQVTNILKAGEENAIELLGIQYLLSRLEPCWVKGI